MPTGGCPLSPVPMPANTDRPPFFTLIASPKGAIARLRHPLFDTFLIPNPKPGIVLPN